MGKSKLAKKKANSNSKYWKDKADDIRSIEIRAVGSCEYCGRVGLLNAHHIISRTRLRFRFDLSNGIALCSRCHLFDSDISPHADSFGGERFLEWLKTERPGQYQWFQENKHDKRQPEKTYQESFYELKGE